MKMFMATARRARRDGDCALLFDRLRVGRGSFLSVLTPTPTTESNSRLFLRGSAPRSPPPLRGRVGESEYGTFLPCCQGRHQVVVLWKMKPLSVRTYLQLPQRHASRFGGLPPYRCPRPMTDRSAARPQLNIFGVFPRPPGPMLTS